jgi:hypothetical protein
MQEKQPPEKIRRIPTFQEELPPTHKVNTDGADVAVDVGVILDEHTRGKRLPYLA